MTLTVPDFSTGKVVVAGDVMLDQYLFGATSRISPEAPVPVVHVDSSDDRAGGAANVAVNLAALGVATKLIGVVGQDTAGETLARILKARQIGCTFVRVTDRPTITKTRVQSRGQQLIRLDRETTPSLSDPGVLDALKSDLPGAQVVVLSDYGKGALTDVAAMIDACRAAGVPVLVDPKGTDFDKYRGATLLTPNLSEFEAVAGHATSDSDLAKRGQAMLFELDLQALVITRSEKGMLLLERNQEPLFLSAQAREVFDVTGAGDTVIATLAGALASGEVLSAAAALANIAAGLVVRKIGVANVTPSEIRIAMHQRGQGGGGVVDASELLLLVGEARSRKARVVMTNGVFDILHAGHVAYLEEAKGLGDRLIVAVNDDASVRRLKGESRPVNPLEDRMLVLAGLAAVDWVVPFTEDTPAGLIEAVVPDVLVKGGDYRPEDIAGGKAVLKSGGEVRVLAFRDGRSTSNIIERLKR
ncbi:MAG TPA: bifunctional D-glycero-beta-D-manno-heptose-7-phosphate kinase/D-glycero-beta-D-manno-heptose 1-phosphate adenylyltransferase HldE [Woeseiaceae bacterium]|nr:bifunctional D-glycero-beta-D-manno-heptose-7-phosphate kinase/D-glycero-beta-D-manno-heptose 1-phosphate adenylyltransferase HldE [Woeseiaceae bacterium]